MLGRGRKISFIRSMLDVMPREGGREGEERPILMGGW